MACASPSEVRAKLPPGAPVVAFQCRNPIHKAHFELVRRSLEDVKGSVVLVHPTVGPTQPDDIPGEVRVQTYHALAVEVGNPRLLWEFLPFNMRMAGPREAIQHMIIRKNYGCTHFIIGRDMAGCKSSIDGEDFYGAYDAQVHDSFYLLLPHTTSHLKSHQHGRAMNGICICGWQEFAIKNAKELGVVPVPSLNLVYTEQEDYVTQEYAKEKGLTIMSLSGTKFRKMLRAGEDIPTWFAFPSVVKVRRALISCLLPQWPPLPETLFHASFRAPIYLSPPL
jgi:sulfate adenylyltransferase